MWEVNYLVSKIKVRDVMTKQVLTITEDTPIEEAARILIDNKIGGLPVITDGKVVGIITETDLFKIMLEMMGARQKGVRASVLVPNEAGEIARLSKAIFNAGGNIIALGTFLGEDPQHFRADVQGFRPGRGHHSSCARAAGVAGERHSDLLSGHERVSSCSEPFGIP